MFAVKLLLLDHGEVIKCMSLDDELLKCGATKDETLADEIAKQHAVLDTYELEYASVSHTRPSSVVRAAMCCAS